MRIQTSMMWSSWGVAWSALRWGRSLVRDLGTWPRLHGMLFDALLSAPA